MRFTQAWIDLIMRCVTSFSYSVCINGRLSLSFRPSRGIQQRDLLSPFLFLIYNEGLSTLLRVGLRDRLLKGVQANRNGPRVSHLLFIDDSILFGEASVEEA